MRTIHVLTAAVITTIAAFPIFADTHRAEVFIPGHGFHGIHGIAFDDEDRIYVGSVVGQSIYRIDPATGASEVWEGPSVGMADDIEVGADGTLYWTSFMLGKVHARKGDDPVRELASGLTGINSIALKGDGRLFATQVFLGDALYEIDPAGKKPARKIMEDMGGLNGFDFGPDGLLYGPLWFKGQVVKVDVDTAELTVVADGFIIPAAVNFNSKNELFVVDTGSGNIYKVDTATREKTVISEFKTAMDNLAFNSKDELFVTVMAENAVYQIDTKTGAARTVKESALALPMDIDIHGNTLYISDTFAMRSVDLSTKKVTSLARIGGSELEYSNGITATEKYVHQASFFNSAVQTLDAQTGEILHTYHDLPTAFDVLERPDGTLLLLQMFTGSILHLDGDTKPATIVRGLTTPVAMSWAGENEVYVTLYAKGEVVKVDLVSGDKTVVASGLDHPEGIDVGTDGTIYVAETGAKRAVSINPKSGAITVLASNLPIGMQMAPGMPPMGGTSGIAVADNGDVYVASDVEDAIYKLVK